MTQKPENPPAKHLLIRDSKGRFIKGQSGNPVGRTGGEETLTKLLREYGEKVKRGGETLPLKQHLAETVYTAIIQGYRVVEGEKIILNDGAWVKLLTWLYDRVDGKPTENLQISSPEVEITSEDMAQAMEELEEWKKRRGNGNGI